MNRALFTGLLFALIALLLGLTNIKVIGFAFIVGVILEVYITATRGTKTND